MSAITKEQIVKMMAAWQAMYVLLMWYLNAFGLETFNELAFAIALTVTLCILFLKKDDAEKVLLALSALNDFLTHMGFAPLIPVPEPANQEPSTEREITLESVTADIEYLKEKGINLS